MTSLSILPVLVISPIVYANLGIPKWCIQSIHCVKCSICLGKFIISRKICWKKSDSKCVNLNIFCLNNLSSALPYFPTQNPGKVLARRPTGPIVEPLCLRMFAESIPMFISCLKSLTLRHSQGYSYWSVYRPPSNETNVNISVALRDEGSKIS